MRIVVLLLFALLQVSPAHAGMTALIVYKQDGQAVEAALASR